MCELAMFLCGMMMQSTLHRATEFVSVPSCLTVCKQSHSHTYVLGHWLVTEIPQFSVSPLKALHMKRPQMKDHFTLWIKISVMLFCMMQYETWTTTENYITLFTLVNWSSRTSFVGLWSECLKSSLVMQTTCDAGQPRLDTERYPLQHEWYLLHVFLKTHWVYHDMSYELWRHSG
jgi:hypothetical protein